MYCYVLEKGRTGVPHGRYVWLDYFQVGLSGLSYDAIERGTQSVASKGHADTGGETMEKKAHEAKASLATPGMLHMGVARRLRTTLL